VSLFPAWSITTTMNLFNYFGNIFLFKIMLYIVQFTLRSTILKLSDGNYNCVYKNKTMLTKVHNKASMI